MCARKIVVAALIGLYVAVLAVGGKAEDRIDATEKLGRLLKNASFTYREVNAFYIVQVKMPTGYVQDVFVTKQVHKLGDVSFVEITAIGWQWEEATEFNRQNANWLLKASSETKIGSWQALVFEDTGSIAAEFKATLPLDTTSKALSAAIKGVASSAFELHDMMDK